MIRDIKGINCSLRRLRKVLDFLVEYNDRNRMSALGVSEHDLKQVIDDLEKELERKEKSKASLV